jgi:hypothetical protein
MNIRFTKQQYKRNQTQKAYIQKKTFCELTSRIKNKATVKNQVQTNGIVNYQKKSTNNNQKGEPNRVYSKNGVAFFKKR